MIERNESRRILAEIRRVLWEVWDPIGVRDLGGPNDEYNAYAGGVYHLLINGGNDEEIANYLWQEATERMELDVQRADMYPTVAALRKIWIPTAT